MPSAKRKRDSEGEEGVKSDEGEGESEEEDEVGKREPEGEEGVKSDEGEGESGDEDEDLVSMMATKVQVYRVDPKKGFGMVLPYEVYVPLYGRKTAKIAVQVSVNYLESAGNWKEQEFTTRELDNPKGEECVSVRFELRLVPSPLPPQDDGRKAGVPVRGPSLLSIYGQDTAYVDEVGDNTCAFVLPMSYMPQTVDAYYKLEVLYKGKTAWETAVEGSIIKLVKGDVNNARPLMLQISFDRIYA